MTDSTNATFDAEHIEAVRTAMRGGGYITLDVGEKVLDAYENLYKRFIRLKAHHTAWCAADQCQEDVDAWES